MTPQEENTLDIIQADVAGIHAELKIMNGRMRRVEDETNDLKDEVYGNEEKRIVSLKQVAQQWHDLQVGVKAVLGFLGLVGFTNLIVLFTVLV